MQKLGIIFFLAGMISSLFAYESLNQVLAIVGTKSISQLEYEQGVERYKQISKYMAPNRKKGSLHSQVLDFLIDRAIIDIVSEEESIQVNEKRIEAEIQKRMDSQGITDLEQFKKIIAQQYNAPYEQWIDDLPFQIKKAQLLQLRITPAPPSEQDILAWYNKNKAKVGFEFKFREFVLSPVNTSVDEEQKIFQELNDIRAKSIKDPTFFKLVASGPRNESRSKSSGGLVNWIATFELYKTQPITASILNQVGPGKFSDVFRDDRKRYCLVYVEGMRPTPVDSVRKGIQGLLYREKEQSSFEEWLAGMRKTTSITIIDPVYIKENSITNPEEKYNPD